MDIVKTLNFAHLKASFGNLKLKQKFYLLVFLLALFSNLAPHKTSALTIKAPTSKNPILVFDTTDKSYMAVLAIMNTELTDRIIHEKAQRAEAIEAVKIGKLTAKLRTYLEGRRSPLAEFAHTIVRVENWKKILALANAESSMCRVYPVALANCWGVGGANMWDMGSTLGEGVVAMDQFLENYPLRSKVKYDQMTFKQMNGLYKQPAAPHWLYNVQTIYDDLSVLEKSIN